MATRNNTAEVQEKEQQVTATVENTAAQQELEKLRAENEKMRAQLAAQKKGPNSRESDYDRIHRLEAEAIEAGKDLWEEKVEVFVPSKKNQSEDPWYWLNVNGRPVQFPANDKYQEMRLPWACHLVDTLEAERRATEYKNSLKVYDPKVNPHENEVIRSGS